MRFTLSIVGDYENEMCNSVYEWCEKRIQGNNNTMDHYIFSSSLGSNKGTNQHTSSDAFSLGLSHNILWLPRFPIFSMEHSIQNRDIFSYCLKLLGNGKM